MYRAPKTFSGTVQVFLCDSGIGLLRGSNNYVCLTLLRAPDWIDSMTHRFSLALLAVLAATPVAAQDLGFGGRGEFGADLGLGVQVKPQYPGSDEAEAAPWLIFRNAGFGQPGTPDRQGLGIAPSFNIEGSRDASDDRDLRGLDNIDDAYELGVRVSYGMGQMSGFASVRRGFDGHEGVTGEIGAKYRNDLSDRLTLWSGVEFGYGNNDYNRTYFGVSQAEARSSLYDVYSPDSGFNQAAITFEARYAMTPTIALMGEVRYGKLIGDAGDSPIVQDEYQPSLGLGVVRRFSFGF